jgi:hypothetical protein
MRWLAFIAAAALAGFCNVSIVMTKDSVSQVNYSGPTGGLLTEGEQCAFG